MARCGSLDCVAELDSAMHSSITPTDLRLLLPIIDRVAVAVTTNYSEWVLRAVNTALEERARTGGARRRAVVFSREDLHAFRAPTDNELHVIYLHGRTSSGSMPVFDAWGYNVVRNDDPHYQLVLDRLFAEYDVVTLGTSWSDVPLRDAAAKVLRRRRGARRVHLNPDWSVRDIEWCNAMRVCYGVETIPPPSTPGRVPDFITGLEEFSRRVHPPSPLDAAARADHATYLRNVAEYLEDHGDYESIGHRRWVFAAPASSPAGRESQWTIAQNNLRAMLSTLGAYVDSDWHVVARIERHLRHHVYMYLRDGLRDLRTLWDRLISYASADPSRLDDRLRFDLWLGAHELASGDSVSVAAADPLARPPHGTLSVRYQMADEIWRPTGAPARSSDEVAERIRVLVDGGWEAAAAKLCLDDASGAILRRLNESPPRVISLAERDRLEQASMLARMSGCYRREIKADILRALWLDAPDAGRVRLFGHARSVGVDSVPLIEPPLMVGLAVGIAVCTSRLSQPTASASATAVPRTGRGTRTVLAAQDIVREVVTGLHVLDDGQLRDQVEYWRNNYVHVDDRNRIDWP